MPMFHTKTCSQSVRLATIVVTDPAQRTPHFIDACCQINPNNATPEKMAQIAVFGNMAMHPVTRIGRELFGRQICSVRAAIQTALMEPFIAGNAHYKKYEYFPPSLEPVGEKHVIKR
jgi:hypothetical protein